MSVRKVAVDIPKKMRSVVDNALSRLPPGWFESDPDHATLLHSERQRELPTGHLLFGLSVIVVAHREGTDDILCLHENDLNRMTVIHLTWIGKTEINEKHPTVEVDGTLEDFLDYERKFGIDC